MTFKPFKVISFTISLLTCVILLTSETFAQQEDDVIRIESSIVVVNAVVTDKNDKPVTGLKKKDFEIYVDGKLLDAELVTSFSTEETPFAVVILIDTSGSMEEKMTLARSAAIKFLEGIRESDSVAILNFDTKINLVQDFSNSQYVDDMVFNLKAQGMTVLNDAIYEAAKMLSKREEVRRAIVVLSDGADTFSRHSADKALQAALAANAVIYTVDMSSANANSRERMMGQAALRSFAERSGGRFIKTPGGVALQGAFKDIVSELGNQYTLTFFVPEELQDGKWYSIEVKVKREGVKVRAREGFSTSKKSDKQKSDKQK